MKKLHKHFPERELTRRPIFVKQERPSKNNLTTCFQRQKFAEGGGGQWGVGVQAFMHSFLEDL